MEAEICLVGDCAALSIFLPTRFSLSLDRMQALEEAGRFIVADEMGYCDLRNGVADSTQAGKAGKLGRGLTKLVHRRWLGNAQPIAMSILPWEAE